MAITELVFPTSGTPTVPTDYAYQNGYLAQNAKGYNAVSLTNWDATTTAPEVAAGSAIEINGATWQVDANTAIITTAATAGINYLVFDDGAGAFGWDDTSPTWSATLNGWYVSGNRFTGHTCYWDGVSAFLNKVKRSNSQDGAISETPAAGGVLAGSVRLDWLHLLSDEFAAPAADPYGLTLGGSNLISCDATSALIYIHVGVTASTSSSFASPSSQPSGLAFDGTNLISCDATANRIYIHSGITATTTSNFAAPSTQPIGLTFDGTNLISCDSASNLIYIHTGITSTVSSSFASPATNIGGLAFDGTNLISCDTATNIIYIHKGITSSIYCSFSAPASSIGGLSFIGSNLYSCDFGSNKIYSHGI